MTHWTRWLLVLAPVVAAAALAPAAAATSLFGRDFRLAWPRTADATPEDPRYDLDAQLVVLAADQPVSVRVTAPGINQVLAASPGSPATLRLPRATVMITTEDAPVARGIRVTREGNGCALFSVLLRVPGSGSSVADEVARILPVDVLGRRYAPVAYWGASEFVVVATRAGTSVTIDDPTCPLPGTRTLDAGEALMHRCVDAPGDGSITGSIVTASEPVAVISGSEASSIISHEGPTPGSRGFWGWADVLLESPWPIDMLGREALHVPFRRDAPASAGDLVRIVAGCADTLARVTEEPGTRSFGLPVAGAHVDIESPDLANRTWRLVPGAARIAADRGVLVAAFTVGNLNAGVGDPSMTVLDSVERWERAAVAWLPPGYEHSLGIVTESAATASVRLDGAPIAGTWSPVPGTTHAWIRLDGVAAGERRVTGSEPLTAIVSGFTPRNAGAYSYAAVPLRAGGASGAIGGLRVDGVDACGTTCPGTCVTLRAPPGFASHQWSNGATGAQVVVCPDVTTVITLVATDATGCRYEGSATLHVLTAPSAPVVEGPAEVCEGECVTLAAPIGYDTYLWSTGETTRTVAACPLAATTYSVTVTGAAGCGGSDDHAVSVYPPPVAGDAMVTDAGPCVPGLDVTWLEPQWRPGSPGGVVNIYRRDGACAAVDDPSWVLVASGLVTPPWRDITAVTGRTHAYLIEAEDAAAEGACGPGPSHGGPTGRRCARPNGGIADPGDPDAGRLVSFSPHLRAQGYERQAPGGVASAVTFHWPTLPPLDPATHVEAWRGTDPRALVRVAPDVSTPSWRDPSASDAWLLFYKIFNATTCGTLGG